MPSPSHRLTLSFLALLAPAALWAQPSPDDRAVAESLFRDGRRLMDAGAIAQACRKLEESQRLDPAPGTLLNLAVCHEKEGKVATAWADFHQALAAARREGRGDREQLARERIAALEPLVPKLTLDVSAGARVPGLRVTRNGSPLLEGAWGTPIPVDPGTVTIEATAPSYKAWRSVVQLVQGGAERVAVPPLEPLPIVSLPPPPPAASASAPPPLRPPPPPSDQGSGRRTAGFVIGGAGVVSLVVGGIAGARAVAKRSDSDALCPTVDGRERCSRSGAALNDEARSSAHIADVTIGVGLVAVAAGAYLVFAAPGPVGAGAGSRSQLSLSLAPRSGGLAAGLGGAW